MCNTRILQVRLTKEQHARIKLLAEQKGYLTISSFIRDLTLGQNLSTQNMIVDIWKKLECNRISEEVINE